MTILGISAAARAAGVNRSTLQRAIKTGRLSATIDAAGERGIDLAELLRVFGPLRQVPQEDATAPPQPAAPIAAADATVVELLREQLRQAQEREQQAREREHQAQEREARLLTMLETAQQVLQAEQQARRDLEQKLLPPPQPDLPPRRHRRLWLLLAILALAVAALVWTRTSAYWPLGG
jgi:hypothetical protein